MRKLLLLLLALSLAQAGWCQQKSIPFAALQHQLSLHRLTFRLSTIPMAGVQHQRHSFAAGPVILLKESFAVNHHYPKLSGLQLTYQYLLASDEEAKFRLYAELSSKGQLFTEKWYSNYWDENLQQYRDVEQKSRELLLEGYAGIGLRYQALPRLYIQSSGLAGYGFSDQQRKGNAPNSLDNSSGSAIS